MSNRTGFVRRGTAWFVICTIGISIVAAANENSVRERTFTFDYTTRIGPIEAGAGPVHVFVPLARASDRQTIESEEIRASIPGGIEIDKKFSFSDGPTRVGLAR